MKQKVTTFDIVAWIILIFFYSSTLLKTYNSYPNLGYWDMFNIIMLAMFVFAYTPWFIKSIKERNDEKE